MVKRQAHSQFLRRMSQLGTLTNKQNNDAISTGGHPDLFGTQR